MTTQEKQVSQTISRTIRINDGNDVKLDGFEISVSKSEKGRAFIQCADTNVAEKVFNSLNEQEKRPLYISYSLYAINNSQMTEEEFRNIALSICPNVNITYMRVNNNGTTGKLVVDILDDYLTFKKQTNNDNIKFFHFNNRKPDSTQSKPVERPVARGREHTKNTQTRPRRTKSPVTQFKQSTKKTVNDI